MEILLASAVGVLTASGIYLILRQRTFPVILGLSLISYAVNVFLFATGRLALAGNGTGRTRDPFSLRISQPPSVHRETCACCPDNAPRCLPAS